MFLGPMFYGRPKTPHLGYPPWAKQKAKNHQILGEGVTRKYYRKRELCAKK